MKWDTEKLNELKALHQQGMSIQDLASNFNVSIFAIKAVLYRKTQTKNLRKRSKYVKWDENLEHTIASMIEKSVSLTEIAESMNISYSSLTSKMRRLNMRFYKPIGNFYTQKNIVDLFNVTESQFRQVLNNRTIDCHMRGNQLLISHESLVEWLSNGNAMLYTPHNVDDEKWIDIWKKSVATSFTRICTMSEISDTYRKSKMAISYYGKKKNFPPVVGYLNSYNIYNRNDVNDWSIENGFPVLSPFMKEEFFKEFATGRVVRLYEIHKEDIMNLISQ